LAVGYWLTPVLPGATRGFVQDFRNLRVWQAAHALTMSVYRITARFPRSEAYGLTAQIRRSASSIGANLAEGSGRNGDAEFARFCSIAMGSASELDYQLLLAGDLQFLKPEDYAALAERTAEVRRMLNALLQTLNRKPAKSQQPKAKS
jgi:four helix bundle protein